MAFDNLRVSSEYLGLGRLGPNPKGSIEATSDLLSINHERWHMFFREVAGHNHIPHAILTTLAMGGGPKELKRAYDDGEGMQRPMPPVEDQAVNEMSQPASFRERMQILDEYPNFLAFFKKEISEKGNWKDVVNSYCFSRTPLADFMLAQLFEGLYHPIIHLGFGVEFNLPGLVAEGLAQAASQDGMGIDVFFQRAEKLVQSGSVAPTPLAKLYTQVRANSTIRTAARVSDGPWKVRDGVLGRAMEEITQVAAQFQVHPTEDDIERATAEMISCAAWACATSHKEGRERKIDFFLMHNVTCSLFLTVLGRQPWIRIEDRARLVEWKARLDLVWYAASAAPELRPENLMDYEPTLSRGMDWNQIYQDVNRHHDDGHVAKFVRALKNGEEMTLPFERHVVNGDDARNGKSADFLPVKGNMWLKVAQLCYDTTIPHSDGQKKWIWGAGFDPMWDAIPEHLKDTYR